MTEVTKNLDTVVATTYGLLLKTLNYHWNVTGPNFSALHALFEMQYNEMILGIDVIAERARTLGTKIDATFGHFSKLSEIKEGDKNANHNQMVKDLIEGNRHLAKILKEGIEIAENNNDKATADLLTARVEAHEKNAWMLESSI